MRDITRQAIEAFLSATHFAKQNTEVHVVERPTEVLVRLLLHGNIIATRTVGYNLVDITTAGWNTATTRERLNGLPNVNVSQRKGQLYLNGHKWSGVDALVPMKGWEGYQVQGGVK